MSFLQSRRLGFFAGGVAVLFVLLALLRMDGAGPAAAASLDLGALGSKGAATDAPFVSAVTALARSEMISASFTEIIRRSSAFCARCSASMRRTPARGTMSKRRARNSMRLTRAPPRPGGE